MDKQELLALASAVEKLEGPNYAMEIEIFKAIHPEYADYVQGRGGLVHPYDGSDVRVLSDVRPPNYTASIDAAMALVPDHCWIRMDEWPGGFGQARGTASVHPIRDPAVDGHCAKAETLPLALTAASLRAIASQEGE